jgi:hypothetical protein
MAGPAAGAPRVGSFPGASSIRSVCSLLNRTRRPPDASPFGRIRIGHGGLSGTSGSHGGPSDPASPDQRSARTRDRTTDGTRGPPAGVRGEVDDSAAETDGHHPTGPGARNRLSSTAGGDLTVRYRPRADRCTTATPESGQPDPCRLVARPRVSVLKRRHWAASLPTRAES